jgi:hypothetical protein
MGHARNPVRDHRRLAHQRTRQRRGFGHRVDHHRFERTLAQFAGQQPDEEVALVRGGTLEQSAKLLRAFCLRPGPRHAGKRFERGVDVGDG